jgi:hypothetical protein
VSALSLIANSRDNDFRKCDDQSSQANQSRHLSFVSAFWSKIVQLHFSLRFSRYVPIGGPVCTSSDTGFEVASENLERSMFPQYKGPFTEIKNMEE